ncbi:hypothetical protein ANTQUA_LOCUS8610, partial [Anthophora quadrimaculata]
MLGVFYSIPISKNRESRGSIPHVTASYKRKYQSPTRPSQITMGRTIVVFLQRNSPFRAMHTSRGERKRKRSRQKKKKKKSVRQNLQRVKKKKKKHREEGKKTKQALLFNDVFFVILYKRTKRKAKRKKKGIKIPRLNERSTSRQIRTFSVS